MYIAERESLPHDWLDNALNGLFCAETLDKEWVEYPGLRIYIALPAHMLAMKIATSDSHQDCEDIKLLAKKLHLSSVRDVLSSIEKYIPKPLLAPEMREIVKQCFSPSRKNHKEKV